MSESQPGIQLIIGLANPGKTYQETRHNAGAWLLTLLAERAATHLHTDSKLHGYHALVKSPSHYHLLIPTTFMNHSGKAVQACLHYFKIAPNNLLVLHDDIDLPVGTIKIKFGGGDGGHNGLKDIIRHTNTKEFYRCRIGVGRPMHQHDVVDYVLSPPSRTEKQAIQTAMMKIPDLLPLLLAGEIQKAMQNLHTETSKNVSS
jgi:peptidyl-tRNA hydrolase, PTH1 family